MLIQNTKTNKFLKGYQGNKPLWTAKGSEAASYCIEDIIRLRRRLAVQSQTTKVLMREVKNDKKKTNASSN